MDKKITFLLTETLGRAFTTSKRQVTAPCKCGKTSGEVQSIIFWPTT